MSLDSLELAFDPVDFLLGSASVGLQLRFSFTTTHPDASLLARKVDPVAGEPWQQMLKERQLHLQFTLAALGSLGEDIED